MPPTPLPPPRGKVAAYQTGFHEYVFEMSSSSLFISLISFTYSIDVSTPRSPDCEISASCFHSQKCQPPFQTITVRPKDSKVTSNCSIVTGGKVQDMTWQDLEKNLNASKTGLFLQQIDSKDGNESCRCFSIQYASKYFLSLPLFEFIMKQKTGGNFSVSCYMNY